MIYVLKSAGYDESNKFIELIKIGFTDNWEKRFASYLLHNPTIVPLFLIEGGTMDDEYCLHKYFQKYRYKSYGNEWFQYSESIIKFFSEFSTIEEMREIILIPRQKDSHGLKISIIKQIASIMEDSISLDYQIILNRLVQEQFVDMSQIFYYIRNNYSDTADTIIDKIIFWYQAKKKIDKNDQKSSSILEGLFLDFMIQFKNAPDFYQKMKVLCEEDLSDSYLRELVLESIPNPFKKYYIVLGPDVLKRLSYNNSLIKKEYDNASLKIKDSNFTNTLKDKILNQFTVGEKYDLAYIKLELSNIYEEVGLQKKAKASDIQEWIEVKKTQFRANGKVVNGFELLKIK